MHSILIHLVVCTQGIAIPVHTINIVIHTPADTHTHAEIRGVPCSRPGSIFVSVFSRKSHLGPLTLTGLTQHTTRSACGVLQWHFDCNTVCMYICETVRRGIL
jgi:hypothetical protein